MTSKQLDTKDPNLAALLKAQRDSGLTQAQIAERMGISAAKLAHKLNSLYCKKTSPSFAMLIEYAKACGKTLRIELV
jgi:transcriptional regulator with XRE-family HTH domain